MYEDLNDLYANHENMQNRLELMKTLGTNHHAMMADIKKFMEEFAFEMKQTLEKIEVNRREKQQILQTE